MKGRVVFLIWPTSVLEVATSDQDGEGVGIPAPVRGPGPGL